MLDYHSLPSKKKFCEALEKGNEEYFEKYKKFFLDDVLKALEYAKKGGNLEILRSLQKESNWKKDYVTDSKDLQKTGDNIDFLSKVIVLEKQGECGQRWIVMFFFYTTVTRILFITISTNALFLI